MCQRKHAVLSRKFRAFKDSQDQVEHVGESEYKTPKKHIKAEDPELGSQRQIKTQIPFTSSHPRLIDRLWAVSQKVM